MSSTGEVLTIVASILVPFLTAAGVIGGQWIGRKQGLKQADAAVQSATSEARKAVTADWEAYTGMLLKRLDTVETRAGAAEKRIDTAETRAVIAEERATRWESLYRIAVLHMRQLIEWASNVSHLSDMPEAPAELRTEL